MWSAKVLFDQPELVTALHEDFIKAGADVICLNAYAVTPERVARDGDVSMFEPLQRAAVEAARRACDASDRTVRIAGCLPPLVASYHAELVPHDTQCQESYARIADLQAENVDLFMCETMSCVREAVAAVSAAKSTGKPVWAAFTTDDGAGRSLRSGEPLIDGVTAAVDAGADGVLVNCTSPEAVLDAMPVLADGGVPYGGYANGFVAAATLSAGGTVDGLVTRQDLDPESYARHAESWVTAGATIVGGCCEVGPAHIAAIASRLGR